MIPSHMTILYIFVERSMSRGSGFCNNKKPVTLLWEICSCSDSIFLFCKSLGEQIPQILNPEIETYLCGGVYINFDLTQKPLVSLWPVHRPYSIAQGWRFDIHVERTYRSSIHVVVEFDTVSTIWWKRWTLKERFVSNWTIRHFYVNIVTQRCKFM